MKKIEVKGTVLLLIIILMVVATGCYFRYTQNSSSWPTSTISQPTISEQTTPTIEPTLCETLVPTTAPTLAIVSTPTAEPTPTPKPKLIVLDAGHQAVPDYSEEPIGPGSTIMKRKVSSGTQGKVTRINEYELNLILALKLQVELEKRGYEVLMTRTTHDVNLSNSQRAIIANEAKADAYIRIHANGSDNPEDSGILTVCPKKDNPYNPEIYEESKALSVAMLDEMAKAMGCKKLFVWETDTMTGINWSKVPVTILEVGYMSNAEEDALLATEEYQDKIVQGIANGLDLYFK